MASETGPDLAFAAQAVEALMDDTCTISRIDDEGQDEDLDPETLLPIRGLNDLIYEGRCSVSRDETADVATLAIPILSPALAVGDVVTITSSRRDPYLPGRRYHVTEIVYKTMAISRKSRMVLV